MNWIKLIFNKADRNYNVKKNPKSYNFGSLTICANIFDGMFNA